MIAVLIFALYVSVAVILGYVLMQSSSSQKMVKLRFNLPERLWQTSWVIGLFSIWYAGVVQNPK